MLFIRVSSCPLSLWHCVVLVCIVLMDRRHHRPYFVRLVFTSFALRGERLLLLLDLVEGIRDVLSLMSK